ncbi:MAG: hypothetical protein ACR2P5_01860 [Gammaproteobacteria bacterium]
MPPYYKRLKEKSKHPKKTAPRKRRFGGFGKIRGECAEPLKNRAPRPVAKTADGLEEIGGNFLTCPFFYGIN